ncbi:MAG TPA: 30S ribosomal protein S7 [bacterium]
MPRHKRIQHRHLLRDPKYNDILVSKLINTVLRAGKKTVAQKIVYDALALVEKKSKQESLKVFLKAIENITPLIETRPRRVGGATYQVPMEIPERRKISLAIRWLVQFANDRSEKNMSARLASEILDAIENKGGSIKKREDTHKMAEANRAFAHYRW